MPTEPWTETGGMGRILIRKLLLGAFYILAISFVAFFMSLQMPGDPAELIANQFRETEAPPALVEQVRHEYGFDKSWLEQYRRWLIRFVKTGDLGYSSRSHLPVMTELKKSLPVTLHLATLSFLLTIAISLPLGVYAGITRNYVADYLIQGISWVSYALPVFLVGNILIWLFSVKYKLLPSIGHDTWQHSILPVATLSLHLSGWTIQIIRSSVEEITRQDYILAAKARGLTQKRIVFLHTLKPALLPIITALLIQAGTLISGSFIIEVIFAWNGIGRLLIESIMARDFPMIQGIILYVGGAFALINILIDLLYVYVDPTVSTQLAGGR
jgi:ABC-type dipeptide/oligopeptide/nickel transport system permease component